MVEEYRIENNPNNQLLTKYLNLIHAYFHNPNPSMAKDIERYYF